MDSATDWAPLLTNVDVVVNASGALQDGLRDDLRATQERAMRALVDGCEQGAPYRFVQISAPGADPDANTRFQRTKGRADQHLRNSRLDWVILRPGLVLGAGAYGGTALLRMLAAFPVVQPLAYADAPVQCASLDEVARLTARAASGAFPAGTCVDLVEPESHTLREVVGAMAEWLGQPARRPIDVPGWISRWVGRGADVLGLLGWRSPLRSTALAALAAGVTADSKPAIELLGQPLMSLEQILAQHPATVQDRWFARLYLLLPIAIATLACYWVTSGVIALVNMPAAAAVLPPSFAAPGTFVTVASLVDIGLGLAVLVRPWARFACWGMVAVTGAYLLGATWLVPELWLDPLGPLVKPIPAMVLALIAPTLLRER